MCTFQNGANCGGNEKKYKKNNNECYRWCNKKNIDKEKKGVKMGWKTKMIDEYTFLPSQQGHDN